MHDRPYDEELADGLQVLRYNVSKAYIPYVHIHIHMQVLRPATAR